MPEISRFNRRLKKFCSEAGIEYRSSHKIRFCGASILYQIGDMTLDQLRRVMGHSNSRMTEHYAQQNVQEPVNTGIMQSVLGQNTGINHFFKENENASIPCFQGFEAIHKHAADQDRTISAR